MVGRGGEWCAACKKATNRILARLVFPVISSPFRVMVYPVKPTFFVWLGNRLNASYCGADNVTTYIYIYIYIYVYIYYIILYII